MNTCSTCRWWGETWTNDGRDLAECVRLFQPESKAYTCYDDSALMTQPDFGCNQWEEQSNATT